MTSTDDFTNRHLTEEELLVSPGPPAAPAPPANDRERRAPIWALWAGAVAGALMVFAIGFGLGVHSIADDRDAARAATDAKEEALADARAETDASNTQLAECTDLAESAAALQESGDDLADGWKAFVGLMDAWALTAVGSPEEVEAVQSVTQQVTKMDTKVGELNAVADRVDGDVSACEAT
jgi:hypothetical protein